MTTEEALAELGLSASPDADTLRRTYLRLLKTRKPETDPEGFRRLRDAYDVLRGAKVAVVAAAAAVAAIEEQLEEQPPGESLLERIAEDDLDGAAKLARRRLDAALADPSVGLLEGPLMIDLILRLNEAGALRPARAITRKLQRYFEMLGGARLLSPNAAGLFGLLRDLAELPDEFPSDVHLAFSKAIRQGKPVIAARAIAKVRTRDGDGAVDAIRWLLEEHAPTLHVTYGGLVAARVAPPRQPYGKYGSMFGSLIFILYLTLRMCSGVKEPPGPAYSAPVLPPLPNVPVVNTPLSEATSAAANLATIADGVEEPGLAAEARAFHAVADCNAALPGLKTLVATFATVRNRNKTNDLRVALDMVRRGVGRACNISTKDLP